MLYDHIKKIQNYEKSIQEETDLRKKDVLTNRLVAYLSHNKIEGYKDSLFYKIDDVEPTIKSNSKSPELYYKRPADLQAVLTYNFLNLNPRLVLEYIINRVEDKLSWIKSTRERDKIYTEVVFSHQEVADHTGLQRQNIKRSLDELQDKNIISVYSHVDGRGKRTRVCFNPNWDSWSIPEPAKELGYKKLLKLKEYKNKTHGKSNE